MLARMGPNGQSCGCQKGFTRPKYQGPVSVSVETASATRMTIIAATQTLRPGQAVKPILHLDVV